MKRNTRLPLRKTPVLLIFALLLSAFALPADFTGAMAQSDKAEKTPRKPKQFGYRPESVSLNERGKSDPLTGANKGKAFDIAVGLLRQNRQKFGLSESDLLDLKVMDEYTSQHNGVTHIYLRQQIAGIEVAGAEMNSNLTRDGQVINLNTSFVKGLRAAANRSDAVLTPQQAVAAAAAHLGLTITEPLATLETRPGAERQTTFSKGGISLEPIRVKLIFQPVAENQVRLAWSVEVCEVGGEHWWNLSVDAETAAILAGHDYIDHDNWDKNFVPDAKRNRNLAARYSAPARARLRATTATTPSLAATVNDGSSYNVYAYPLESPSDGASTLVFNPADALASPYGWHDTNGAAGAEYTRTRGNNVHAYTDLDANNLVDTNSDPDGGANLQFNFQFDPTLAPASNRPPAVVNLFYWNNIIHDVFYLYGFNEAAGNFQTNNYARGGAANDYVQAEAQDGSGTNNANFGTPVDGQRPRMQMYVWTFPLSNAVIVNAPSSIAGNYPSSSAGFGPALTATGVTGDVVLALDAADAAGPSTTDGCSALSNASSLAGKVALLDRGTCGFVVKVKNAQNAGAIAVIVGNNVAGDPITMGGTDATINIPSVMVTLDDANLYKANLPFNASLKINPNPPPSRDSDFDAGIIAHEYGHGISNRLTGGPSTTSCLGNQEQMGEGWSDYIGLVLTTNPTDLATTARGIGTYVSYQPGTGNGIRPTPYTTDMTVNPSTYNTIKTAAVPHGVGYVWATMLWEMYWNLVEAHGYNPNVYDAWNTGGNNLAIQLVTDGMKLQPCSPGFVSGRDAILQADRNLTGGANQCRIWKAFAKRGLGFSATQGSTGSVTDGTEAFDLPASCDANVISTTLSVNPATGTSGGTVNLSATLTDGTSGIGGKSVSFTLNGTSAGSATTDANGVASLANVSLGNIAPGTYPNGVGANFAAGGGYGGSSATNILTVLAGATPAAPTALTVAAGSKSGQLVLNWTDNSNNESGFRIERCTGATCTNFAPLVTVGADVRTYTNSGLARRTTYRYRLYAYNASGNSGFSNIGSATTR